MRQIRMCAFETNSSSTHSICISSDRKEKLFYPEHVHFKCGGFGWKASELKGYEEKASYLYSSILSLYSVKKAENAKAHIMDMLAEEGITCSFEPATYIGDSWCSNAYVDHCGEDSHGRFVELILKNKKRLLRYLFSDKSFVLTGNDNEDTDVSIHVDYKHEEYYKGN